MTGFAACLMAYYEVEYEYVERLVDGLLRIGGEDGD